MYVARRGNEVTALSYSPADQARATRRASAVGFPEISSVSWICASLTAYGGLGQYDQVICLEVIEHILDDRKLLRDLAAVTRPGGRLLLTTPYRDHIPVFGEEVSPQEDGHHVRRGYTHEEMVELLAEAGFHGASSSFVSGIVSQRAFSLMYRLNRAYPHLGWILSLPLRLLRPLDGPLTRLTGYPYLSIGVVAVRS